MNDQKSSILSERKGYRSISTKSTEPGRTQAVGGRASVPRFHRSEFLMVKKTVEGVLCWFKSLVVLKHVKHELYFVVELVNHLLSLLQLDKKYGVDLQVLKYTIGKLSAGLVMVKAKAMENVEIAMKEERDIQRQARRNEERMATVREAMERTARWVTEVAASKA
ncbi:hypothetical protein C7212DRAFT_343231 [Tuber magnatum]|uniref:Uncharacterized protein n=1 Tax=Tuber magnatum TaxID=42249 RepID=A0A317SXE2_9PEZI|nr:hypothetical protein C7212DRAFT_343231 [Tuber magnatum]